MLQSSTVTVAARPGALLEQPILYQVFLISVYAVMLYAGLQLTYGLGASITVALGLCRTCDWRPLFGPLGDAYTVRRFWG